jgi:hypothetical protein
MSGRLPWDGIKTPSVGHNWLRSDLSSRYSFWWGRNANGWPVLLFELDGDYGELFRGKRPKAKGLEIDLVALTDRAKQGFVISLLRPSDADIFYRLCLSTIEAASEADIEGQAVLSVLNHLERWRDFLANARKRLLSPDEIRGLFAELVVIRELVQEYGLAAENVVSAWQGPLRKPQDFEFPAVNLEVKAFGGASGAAVEISSEKQLQPSNVPLYLVAVELFDGGSEPSRSSLNGLVRELEMLVQGNISRTFRDRLAITGYSELPEYDAPEFAVGRIEIYHAREGFPAIRADELAAGISNVRYDLDLNSAREFLVPKIPTWDAAS